MTSAISANPVPQRVSFQGLLLLSEGVHRLAELALSIFEIIEKATLTLSTSLKSLASRLHYFVTVNNTLFLFKRVYDWSVKNQYGEHIWETQSWRSTLQLAFKTAVDLLGIPNALKTLRICNPGSWIIPLDPISKGISIGECILGVWENRLELYRLQEQSKRVFQLKKLWTTIQKERSQMQQSSLAILNSSIQNMRCQYPQDKRDQTEMNRDIQELYTLVNNPTGNIDKAYCSSRIRKWKIEAYKVDFAKRYTWITIAVNIVALATLVLALILPLLTSGGLLIIITLMHSSQLLIGFRLYLLKCTYKEIPS